jgi:hypothetical protein
MSAKDIGLELAKGAARLLPHLIDLLKAGWSEDEIHDHLVELKGNPPRMSKAEKRAMERSEELLDAVSHDGEE